MTILAPTFQGWTNAVVYSCAVPAHDNHIFCNELYTLRQAKNIIKITTSELFVQTSEHKKSLIKWLFPFSVTWIAETPIIRIGETAVLACTIHGVPFISLEETRMWYKGSNIATYNGQTTNPLKYMESLYRNKFKLFIYNVTEADLNCDYLCLYSFDKFSKSLKITEDNFECKHMTSYILYSIIMNKINNKIMIYDSQCGCFFNKNNHMK